MITMAQKISITKGLGMGMAQLGAFARIGMMQVWKYWVLVSNWLIKMNGMERREGEEGDEMASIHYSSLKSPHESMPFDPPMQLRSGNYHMKSQVNSQMDWSPYWILSHIIWWWKSSNDRFIGWRRKWREERCEDSSFTSINIHPFS